jgi:hypothetical protein
MSRAELKHTTNHYLPPPAPSAGVQFVVLTQARSDGRQGSEGIRRYNCADIRQALRRFETESSSPSSPAA